MTRKNIQAAHDRAKAIWSEYRGQIKFETLSKILAKEKHGTIATPLLRAWKQRDKWEDFPRAGIQPQGTLVKARAKAITILVDGPVDPVAKVDHVIEATLTSIIVLQHKAQAAIDAMQLKGVDQVESVTIMCGNMAAIIDRMLKLRSSIVSARAGSLQPITEAHRDALDGEIIPPEKDEAAPSAPLADRLDAFRKARS